MECTYCGYKLSDYGLAPGRTVTHFFLGEERGEIFLGRAKFVNLGEDRYKCPRCDYVTTLNEKYEDETKNRFINNERIKRDFGIL